MDTKMREQIDSDIARIQEEYKKGIPRLEAEDFAFNFWVLTKLFMVDEELAINYITDGSDLGIDCWMFFEEAKELYLIQNKYYSTSKVSPNNMKKEFLLQPLSHLISDGYEKKSQELQGIFSKYKNDVDFKIHLQLYTTQNERDERLSKLFSKHDFKDLPVDAYIDASVYYLDDIAVQYYGRRKEDTKKFKHTITTRNKATQLSIDPENYKLPTLEKARYILTPVLDLYEMIRRAKKEGYQLFEENLREYLGEKGINAGIINTLRDPQDRENFFFYNNGVTIICESYDSRTNTVDTNAAETIVHQPQIVNGCQTVNSIFAVIDRTPEPEKKIFSETFVMVKVLQIDKTENENLYTQIVRFNNSQNAIKEKDFMANKDYFFGLKDNLRDRGFALLTRQSDKQSFSNDKAEIAKLRERAVESFDFIEVGERDFTSLQMQIPLEKFLQVLLAFTEDGYFAFNKKPEVLKRDSSIHTELVRCITEPKLLIDELLKIWLLYVKAEMMRKKSEDKRTPIPYYVISFIGDDYWTSRNKHLLFERDSASRIFNFYKSVANNYRRNLEERGLAYNDITKKPIEKDVLSGSIKGRLDDLEGIDKDVITQFRATEDL